MAITTGTAVYVGTGPTQSGQIIANVVGGPSEAQRLSGTATVTGDAASATFDVNFIDGTKTINFTPTLILCNRIGGAATATIGVTQAVPVDNKKFTVFTTGTVNAATFIIGFVAIP